MSTFLRDFKNANRYQPNQTPPRLTFNGFVDFAFSPSAYLLDGGSAAGYREQISSLLQTATLPSASFTTQVKKQYNMKRIVQTGVEYKPIDITVVDTINNEWLTLLMKYFSFYYMDPRNKTSGTVRDPNPSGYVSNAETTARPSAFMSTTFDSNAAGFNLSEQSDFFDHIKLVLYHAGRGVEYIVYKPIITSFETGSIDYTESGLRTFTISLEYESFTVNGATNFKLNAQDLSRFEVVSDDVAKIGDISNNPIFKGSDTGSPFGVTGPYPRDIQ